MKTPLAPLWYLTSPEPWTLSGIEVALELAEDLPVALADDVGEDVEASPVRHPDDRVGDAALCGGVEEGVERHDGRLGTFEPEALLADIARVQEALEDLGCVQPLEQVALLFDARRRGDALEARAGSTASGQGPGCACTRCASVPQ